MRMLCSTPCKNGLGTIDTVLAQGFESPLESNLTLVLALLRWGGGGGGWCQLHPVEELDPLDNSPHRRMVMANHAEKRLVPPFTNVLRSVAVIESGLMHIPYRRWKGWRCAATSEVCGDMLGSHHPEAPTYIVLVEVVDIVVEFVYNKGTVKVLKNSLQLM